MTITAKITAENVRDALNGTVTGSNYYFWDQTISSGSVLTQINLANYYLYGILGTTKMDSTDEVTSFHINSCELDYACMRVLVVLSGGVIVEGFDWQSGISIKQPHILNTYINLINSFKESAQLHLRAIQPICVSADSDVPVWARTSPSTY